MIHSTGYEQLINKLAKDLIDHGWGEFTFKVISGKDKPVQVQINCGKSYIFWIKKDIKFDDNII